MNMIKNDKTLAELERLYLSDESAAEFDRLVARDVSRRRRRCFGAAMLAAAASAALVLTLWPRGGSEGFDGLEIAEGIEHILELDSGSIESVTAKPDGGRVVLTAVMSDGSRCSYVMSRAKGTSAVSITATNTIKNK